eukprot:scaffold125818_cov16-Tisochrysis_lutea.AAC.1
MPSIGGSQWEALSLMHAAKLQAKTHHEPDSMLHTQMQVERVGCEISYWQWCLGERAAWCNLASARCCNSSQ